jgi:hypothetical protein
VRPRVARYRLRSLTWPSKHSQARRPALTPQIHLITQRQHGHNLANSPLTRWLEEIRAALPDNAGAARWRSIVNGLAAASDYRAARLQQAEE